MALPLGFPALAAWLGSIVPILIHSIRLALAVSFVFVLVKLLVVFGVSYVSYAGFTLLFNNLQSAVESRFALLGDASAILGMMGADVGIGLLFSAISVVVALKTFNGALRRWVFFSS